MPAKVEEQQQARTMRRQGASLNVISKTLGVSKGSVSLWVRDITLSDLQKQVLKEKELAGARKGHKTNQAKWQTYRLLHPKPEGPRWPQRQVEEFFDTWTPEMAYVLGFFAADGCMYQNTRGSCYIGFYSVDKEMVESIKSLMNVTNQVEEYQPRSPDHQRKYTLQIGSRKIYERLLELGFTPNKSLTLQMPNVPNELLGHFTRGYLDGDGCVYFGQVKRKNRPNNSKVLSVRFTSGSKKNLVSLKKKIKKVTGISTGSIISRTKNHHVLQYSTTAARQLYIFMYPTITVPCLKRKRDVFKKAFEVLDLTKDL